MKVSNLLDNSDMFLFKLPAKSLLPIERFSEVLGLFGSRITLTAWREDDQTVAFRGSKSRNKVSVGEPAEGSLSVASLH